MLRNLLENGLLGLLARRPATSQTEVADGETQASPAAAFADVLDVLAIFLGSSNQEDVHRPVELLDTRSPLTRDWDAAGRFGIRDF
jgi:hypothetical protein